MYAIRSYYGPLWRGDRSVFFPAESIVAILKINPVEQVLLPVNVEARVCFVSISGIKGMNDILPGDRNNFV